MARVATTKTRQVRIVLGPTLAEGLVPDPMALYQADGTPIDPADLGADAALPPIPAWAGVWDEATVYEPYSIVSYNNGFTSGALWFTSPGSDAGIEPGSESEGIWDLMLEVPLVSIPDIPTWYGAWDSGSTYPALSQVTHNNGLWSATAPADPGVEPGVEIDGVWGLMVQGVAP